MSFQSNIIKNAQTVEYGKFVELVGDSRFPAVSVTRIQYRDTSDAFPNNKGLPPLTSVEIYPKFAILSHLTNPEDIKVSLSAENINVNLSDVEDILNIISPNVNDIKTNTNDIENLIKQTNTLLTANSSNTSYLIPKAYITVATASLTSKFFTNFGGVSGYLKNIKGINTTIDPSLPGTEVYLQIWTGDNNLTGVNSKLLFTYSVESESNFDIVFPDGVVVYPLWVVSSLTSTAYTPTADTLFLTITYTT